MNRVSIRVKFEFSDTCEHHRFFFGFWGGAKTGETGQISGEKEVGHLGKNKPSEHGGNEQQIKVTDRRSPNHCYTIP